MYFELTLFLEKIDGKTLTSLLLALCMIVPIVILAIVAFIIAIVKRSKKMKLSKGVKVVEESLEGNEFYELFGADNIISVDCEMSRLTVEVKDIELVNTAGLQEKGASGVLLVGNKVKCNFKENTEAIANYLKGKL